MRRSPAGLESPPLSTRPFMGQSGSEETADETGSAEEELLPPPPLEQESLISDRTSGAEGLNPQPGQTLLELQNRLSPPNRA